MKNLLSKLALGVALTSALAVSTATSSFAFGGNQYYYDQDDNGSTWSFYPGYFSEQNSPSYNADTSRAYGSVAPRRAPRAQHERTRRMNDESR